MVFGYCRVSTAEQNLGRQIEALRDYGIDERNIFCDKMSGVTDQRPALDALKAKLRDGDVIVIQSFDRLARSTRMLLDWVEFFDEIGVDLVSLKENIDTTSPQGKLFFTISAAFSEFERELIRTRQAEGIAIAKAQGRMRGRPRVDQDKLNTAIAMYQTGEFPISKIQEITGISKATIYREIDRRGVQRHATTRP
jgi:DNA invertase Pin-like site-specific DNA recombinase